MGPVSHSSAHALQGQAAKRRDELGRAKLRQLSERMAAAVLFGTGTFQVPENVMNSLRLSQEDCTWACNLVHEQRSRHAGLVPVTDAALEARHPLGVLEQMLV